MALTDEQITVIVREAAKGSALRRDGSTTHRIARAVEAAATAPLLERIAFLAAQVEQNQSEQHLGMVEQAAQPVMMQFRWTNPGDNPRPTESEMSWQEVTPRNRLQTLQDRIGELLAYEYNGRKCYEIRALYTSPPKAAQLTEAQEHKTDGDQCWCDPDTAYKDPETGAKVIVHRRPQ
jgi:hypothetical protein